MSRAADYRFLRATHQDEPEIRALVGGLAMPGTVSVRFEREPDYFLGTTVHGDPCDVLIARHTASDELAAVMVRAERRVFLNGVAARIIYIGQIRIAPRYQGRWLMQRAALEVGKLRDDSAPSLGVIASDNPIALGTIAGRRAPGAAQVSRVAQLHSLAFLLHHRLNRGGSQLPVAWGGQANLEEIVDFLAAMGPRRQFFPVIERDRLTDGRTYRGLRLEDLCVIRRDGEIAGVLGSWDQSRYKQEMVAAYSPRLRRLRPGYDLLARLLGGDRLPRVGQPVRTTFGCLHCQSDDDPDVLEALLHGARDRARRQGAAFLMVGFDARDPQLQTLGRPLAVTYRSDVFLGSFAGDEPAAALDGRPAYIEIGTL